MWIHKKLIGPICKPPQEFKGQLSYLERKFLNWYIIYGLTASTLPTLVFGAIFGTLRVERFLYALISVAIYIFLIWIRAYKALTCTCALLVSGSLLIFWSSPDQLEAYFVPLFVLISLFCVGLSRTSLTVFFFFTCYITWFHAQTKIRGFFQTASREEIDAAVEKSLSSLLRLFMISFCQVLVKSYLQERMYQKWANLKKKTTEQNEALKLSNQMLQEAVNSREEFILGFSHETRNPLNGLIGNLQLLSDMDLPANIAQIVKKTTICSKILKNILLTILNSKKSGHSATEILLTQTSVDMKTFIIEISTLCKDLIKGKGLFPIIEVSPSFPESVIFDSERVTQVALNLVNNAIKFTQTGVIKLYFGWDSQKEGPALNTNFITALDTPNQSSSMKDFDLVNLRKIKAEEKGQLIIAVTDSGKGIRIENQELIFEKFAQINDAHEVKRLGLGLGLWICKTIVDLHNGRILIDSKEGVGSCFTVIIPTSCVPLPAETAHDLNNISTHPKNRSMRALIVEDFPINQTINAEMLKKYGFNEIEIASNGKEGVEIFKTRGPNHFDLITMDLEMPVMQGKEAIKLIREFEQQMNYPSAKIVIISGNAIEKEINECTDTEGPIRSDRFLSKPCDYKTLVHTLDVLGYIKHQPIQLSGKRPKKILVADDDFFNLDLMQSFSSRLEVECITAKNGKEAVEAFAKNISDIHMVFLDHEMPVMNGLEACLAIKDIANKSSSKSCPVYLVSGNEHKGGVPLGFDGYILKPFNFENFRSILG